MELFHGTEGKVGSQAPGRGGVSGGLSESDAAVHPPVVRGHGGGFTRYWTGGGEVTGRDIAEDALPLPALLAAVPAEFGPAGPCQHRNAGAAAGQ